MRNKILVLAFLASLLVPFLAPLQELSAQDKQGKKKDKQKPAPTVTATPTPSPTPQPQVKTEATKKDKAVVVKKDSPVAGAILVTNESVYKREELGLQTDRSVTKRVWHKQKRCYVIYRTKHHRSHRNVAGKVAKKKPTYEQQAARDNKLVLSKQKIATKDITLSVPSDAQLTYLSNDAKQTITVAPLVNNTQVPLKVRARIVSSKPVRAKWESRENFKLNLEPKSSGTTKLVAWVPGTSIKEERTITINDANPSAPVIVQVNPPASSPSQTPTPTPTPTPPPADETVIPAPTVTLTAEPATIVAGGSTVLKWTAANAATVIIDQGIGAVATGNGGTVTVSPAITTTYTITVANNTNSATANATVTVNANPLWWLWSVVLILMFACFIVGIVLLVFRATVVGAVSIGVGIILAILLLGGFI